jgi:hypothetical protein
VVSVFDVGRGDDDNKLHRKKLVQKGLEKVEQIASRYFQVPFRTQHQRQLLWHHIVQQMHVANFEERNFG